MWTHLLISVAASPPGAAQCRTLKGETPLFLAVVHGLRDSATFLLQNGSSPDLQNDEQDSPLVAGKQKTPLQRTHPQSWA